MSERVLRSAVKASCTARLRAFFENEAIDARTEGT
jgi:hypothetical protein